MDALKASKGSWRSSRDWTTFPVRKDWERRVCAAWKSLMGTSLMCINTWRGGATRPGARVLPVVPVTGPEVMDTDWNTGCVCFSTLGYTLLLWGYLHLIVKKPPGLGPEPPHSRWSYLGQVLDKVTLRVPFQPQPFCAFVWIFHRVLKLHWTFTSERRAWYH